MNKQELINKLQDIEWEDFEIKTAKSEIPKKGWENVSAFLNTAGYGFDKMINCLV
jgi:ATP-dependent DNA helicase RecG